MTAHGDKAEVDVHPEAGVECEPRASVGVVRGGAPSVANVREDEWHEQLAYADARAALHSMRRPVRGRSVGEQALVGVANLAGHAQQGQMKLTPEPHAEAGAAAQQGIGCRRHGAVGVHGDDGVGACDARRQ